MPDVGKLNLKPWERVGRDLLWLKEEKVPVTSGKEKASVRKETVAVSATWPKIVRKNQNTLPPHLLSQPYHEVEVCRKREAAEAKVTVDPLLDNRPDIFWRVPARELLVNIGIRPSANSIKQNRVVRRETRVCFLITKLMNNKTKGWKNTSHKSRESEDKGVVAVAKSVSQLGCVSQESDALVSQGTKEFRGDPMQKVLNAIRKVRFTKSTMRQASIREKKGPSLGKTESFLVSEVSTLQNSRIGPTKRLDDNSDVSKTRLGILPTIFTSSKDSRYWPNEVKQD